MRRQFLNDKAIRYGVWLFICSESWFSHLLFIEICTHFQSISLWYFLWVCKWFSSLQCLIFIVLFFIDLVYDLFQTLFRLSCLQMVFWLYCCVIEFDWLYCRVVYRLSPFFKTLGDLGQFLWRLYSLRRIYDILLFSLFSQTLYRFHFNRLRCVFIIVGYFLFLLRWFRLTLFGINMKILTEF